jgi:hypothetical protein
MLMEGRGERQMKKESAMVLLIVLTMVFVVATTYTFTLSIASTTAHEALDDMCRENGYGGMEAIFPESDGFHIMCENVLEGEEWTLELLS